MISSFIVFLSALCGSSVLSEPSAPCHPSNDRYYVSDQEQCDKYHQCDEDGDVRLELLCPDGMVFDIFSKQCVLPIGIDCEKEGRPLLQEPQPTGNCLRLNGRWAVEDTCDSYIDCTAGIERQVTCRNNLIFDDATGNCEHPDVANREGCTAEEIYGFECPSNTANSLALTRYPAEGDCRAFFTCDSWTNFHPRLGGCPEGKVFNEDKLICDEPENVPKCKDYYEESDGLRVKRSSEQLGVNSYFAGCTNGGGLNCNGDAGLKPCWNKCTCLPELDFYGRDCSCDGECYARA